MLHNVTINKFITVINTIVLVPLLFVFFYLLSRHDLVNSIHSFISSNSTITHIELKTLLLIYIFVKSVLSGSAIRVYLGTGKLSFLFMFLIFLYSMLYMEWAAVRLSINDVVYSIDFKDLKYVYIVLIITLYQYVIQHFFFRISLIFILCFFFLNTFYEFILTTLLFTTLTFLKNVKMRQNFIVFLHTVIFIVFMVILVSSTLDFYFFKSTPPYSNLFAYNSHSLLYKNVYHITNESMVCSLKIYSLLDTVFNDLQKIYTQLISQTIISNLYLNIDRIFFKKSLCIFQFSLGLSFILYLVVNFIIL